MDERRDPPPEPGSNQPDLIVSVGGTLSPTQEAWGRYVGHATKCPLCRSLEAGRCGDAEQLHRDYRDISDEAFDRLAEEG